jgi:hypothetical protein
MDKYTNRITSSHRDKKRFMETVRALLDGPVRAAEGVAQLGQSFDLRQATGAQLDIIALWVGLTRRVRLPLEDVYFTLDDADLGFDLGTWRGPFDPVDALALLPDDTFRTLLLLKIRCNQWDGTFEQMRVIWLEVFQGYPLATVFVQDNQDMTLTLGAGGTIPAVLLAAILQGFVPLKPHGVLVNYALSTFTGPAFAFDLDTAALAGFDLGSFATIY